jgi:hypothetical protein
VEAVPSLATTQLLYRFLKWPETERERGKEGEKERERR